MDNQIHEDVSQETLAPETTPEVEGTAEVTDGAPGQEAPAEDFDFSPFLEKLELKVNKEVRKLSSVDEAKEYLQKGADYDRVKDKLHQLESDPLREWAYNWAKKSGFDDPQSFLEAVKAEEEQREIQKLLEANIPEEYAKEMLENKKFREQYEAEKRAQSEQAARLKDYEDFVKAYPDVKEIPEEVWALVNEGKSLTDAYVIHENRLLKEQLQNLKKVQRGESTTTGSLSGSPDTGEAYYTPEQVRAMSRDDVANNYSKIVESMKKWNTKG